MIKAFIFLFFLCLVHIFAQENNKPIISGKVLGIQKILTFNKQGFPIERNTHQVDIMDLFNSLDNKVRNLPVIEIHEDKVFIGFSETTNDLRFRAMPGIYGFLDHPVEIQVSLTNETGSEQEFHLMLPAYTTLLGGWWQNHLFVFNLESADGYELLPQSEHQINQKISLRSEHNKQFIRANENLKTLSELVYKNKIKKAKKLLQEISDENYSLEQYQRLEAIIEEIEPKNRPMRHHFLRDSDFKMFEKVEKNYSSLLEKRYHKITVLELTQGEYIEFLKTGLKKQLKNTLGEFDLESFQVYRGGFFVALYILSKDLIEELIEYVIQEGLSHYFKNYQHMEARKSFSQRLNLKMLINDAFNTLSYVASDQEVIDLYKKQWSWFQQSFPKVPEDLYAEIVRYHSDLVNNSKLRLD